jgi:hypothetical protein
MKQKIRTIHVHSLRGYVSALTDLKELPSEAERYFRGESNDFKVDALKPSIYRDLNLLENEPEIYR